MKKIFYIGTVLLFTFLSGCHSDLNIEQPSEFTSLSMWTSEADAMSAINGAFHLLRTTLATSLPVYGDYRSALYGGGMMSITDYDKMAANVLARDMEGTDWTSYYTTINNCNLILKYAPAITFTQESKKNEVLANAYFIRSFCYFMIARVWGDAPLLTTGFESDRQDDMYPVRTSASEIYAQVEHDLEEAARLMPASVTEKHKASAASIGMLTADYFLWKAKMLGGGAAALENAKTAVNKVLNNSNYGLEENFAKVFGVENEGSKEIIFSINYERNEYVGGYPSYYLVPEQYVENKVFVNNPLPVGSHQQYVSISDEYESFLTSDSDDKRVPVSFQVFQDGTIRWRWINKFKGEWINETRFFSSDIIIYRYAEAILMKAEIENALSNTAAAITELAKIEKRAYKTVFRYSTTMSKEAVDNAIIDEILKEFVSESKSWWTLVRMGQAFTRIESLRGRENEEKILLWPISSSSINTNPNIEE
ncbi:MAG: RagB/SusD family nutrient uptake outer membrane protein [Bacteroidales bacterium]|nr:RagB/SusD family nutrient uptake outer membrane protein [Bacteroidales bacterium]